MSEMCRNTLNRLAGSPTARVQRQKVALLASAERGAHDFDTRPELGGGRGLRRADCDRGHPVDRIRKHTPRGAGAHGAQRGRAAQGPVRRSGAGGRQAEGRTRRYRVLAAVRLDSARSGTDCRRRAARLQHVEGARDQDPELSWSKQGIHPGAALGTPTLWVHDFASGRDEVLDTNSFSAAVRSDGAIAYVRGTAAYRAFRKYTGDLVVRSSLSDPPVVWSTAPAEYVAAAWAGDTLLAYRIDEGEQLDVLALDGPGKQRVLMADANLVAVSPDGSEAFLANEADVPGSVSVVDVADGTIAETLDLGSLDEGILWAAYGGSWLGDLVAAPTNTGIAVFDVGSGAISLSELLKSAADTSAEDLIEPQFTGDTDHIVVRGDAASGEGTTALECELATATCLAQETQPGSAWLHPAYNPSRPKGDDS
jgi:hypothetical protein